MMKRGQWIRIIEDGDKDFPLLIQAISSADGRFVRVSLAPNCEDGSEPAKVANTAAFPIGNCILYELASEEGMDHEAGDPMKLSGEAIAAMKPDKRNRRRFVLITPRTEAEQANFERRKRMMQQSRVGGAVRFFESPTAPREFVDD